MLASDDEDDEAPNHLVKIGANENTANFRRKFLLHHL